MYKEMKKSTKVLSYVFGSVLVGCLVLGIAYGVSTMDSDSSSQNTEYTQTTEASPF